jgi:hypothetical protein
MSSVNITSTNDLANTGDLYNQVSTVSGGDYNGSNIYFVLDGMDVTAQMGVSGELETGTLSFNADAQATIPVSVSTMRKIFLYQTDASSIDDVLSTDIKYKHVPAQWYNIAGVGGVNIAKALVQRSEYPTSGTHNKVEHDFLRHMADELFNTHHGVDLFSNEQDMLNNLEDVSGGVAASLNASIYALLAANSGLYTNDDDVSLNFGRKLLLQLNRSQVGRDRLHTTVDDSTDYQEFPFVSGDEIHMKVSLQAAAGQENLVGKDTAVNDRSYLIRLVLQDEIALYTDVNSATATAIAADGGAPTAHADGGWGFDTSITSSNKINWYFYGDTTGTLLNKLGDIDCMYAIVDVEEDSHGPWINLYTIPTGSNDASWYKTRINNTNNLPTTGDHQIMYFGYSDSSGNPKSLFSHLASSSLTEVDITASLADSAFGSTTSSQIHSSSTTWNDIKDEYIYLTALSTNSANQTTKIRVTEFGYKFKNKDGIYYSLE